MLFIFYLLPVSLSHLLKSALPFRERFMCVPSVFRIYENMSIVVVYCLYKANIAMWFFVHFLMLHALIEDSLETIRHLTLIYL